MQDSHGSPRSGVDLATPDLAALSASVDLPCRRIAAASDARPVLDSSGRGVLALVGRRDLPPGPARAGGPIERQRDDKDRRVVYSALTEKGLGVIDRAIEDHLATEERLLAGLSKTERAQLATLLAKLERSIVDAATDDSGDEPTS